MENMENFRSIDDIPPPYRNIFTEYPCFNAVQSQVLDDILYTDNSVVVSAPTGSGKTAIFELAIIKLLIQYENIDVSQKIKIVYISPIKALCHERLLDWHKKFSPFGLNCVAVTGDSDNMHFQQLDNHNLIISTPEKWDSLTRKWRDHEKIVKIVKLFMIDEVHLLNEENRGSTLEVIVCRMKTVENCMAYCADENDIFRQKVRFVALSATVPNVEDIAEWIGKPPNTKYYRFSEEMRPVKLKKIVYGYSYNPKTSPFKFDLSLNYKLPSLMMQHSDGKPTLIFCSTRKSVEMTANHLVQTLKIHINQEQTKKLLDVANLITDAKAKITIRHGVGYHHAGMIQETRHAIENLFRNGDLPVLVTTSTLALGVNLPAHLVIIKSTKCYDNGGYRDYTETAIHQMIGRAGRPQFDTSATALILTSNEDKKKFENMVSCCQPIESNLHRHLTEHLNAEIVLGTITDLDVAMQWLSSTFLYVRARKNPHHYGINVGLTKEQIDKKLLEMCQIDLNKLVKTGMIIIDQDIAITPTVIGKIMARYYVAFETMKLFTQISGSEILIQILALISKCQEFAPMRLRVNDKKTLNLLNKNSNKNTIRFPLNGRIKTWDMKINCIIQAVLGNLDIIDHSILSESRTIMRNGERIVKCLIEYLETRGTNCYNALLNTIILAKCFHAKLWENSPYVSKQLNGIGSVMSNQLVNAGKTTFQKIMKSNPRDIELIIKRKPPMGNTLIEEVEHIPSYKMTLEEMDSGKNLKLTILLENADDLREKSTVNIHSLMILLVGNSSNEIVVYEKYAHSYMIENTEVIKIIDTSIHSREIAAHFISEDWVGIDCNCNVQNEDVQAPKTKQKAENTKTSKKNGSNYIQMFLDMYMKKKKKLTDNPMKRDKASGVAKGKKKTTEKKTSASATDTNMKQPEETVTNDVMVQQADVTNSEINNVQKSVPEMDWFKNDDADLLFNEEIFKDDVESTTKDVGSTEKIKLDLNAESDVNFQTKTKDESLKENELLLSDLEQEANLAEEIFNVDDLSDFSDEEKITDSKFGADVKENKAKVEEEISQSKPSSVVNLGKIAPSLFPLSQKYGTCGLQSGSKSSSQSEWGSKNKRKKDNIEKAMEFENSLYKEEGKKRQKLEEFKLPAKKKLSHNTTQRENVPDSTVGYGSYYITEILEPSKKQKDGSDQSESISDTDNYNKNRSKETAQKSISWRSPLVISPAVKFSPKFSFQENVSRNNAEIEAENETNNETFETSLASSRNTNLTLNVQRSPKQRQNNTSFMYPHKNRAPLFPLQDKEYNEISETERSDNPFDICSTSLMEKLGFPNQFKLTPQAKKTTGTSPAYNYYSQLLSQPIQARKSEIRTSKKDSNENINKTDENKKNIEQDRNMQLSQIKYNCSQPLDRFREGNQYEDVRDPQNFISVQNRPIPYSNMRHIPQNDLNRSYNVNMNVVQRSVPDFQNPYPQYRDYEMPVPNRSFPEARYQNFNKVNPRYARENYMPMSYHSNFDYPQTSQRLEERFYENYENIPQQLERRFEEHLPQSEAINFSQSRLPDTDSEFHPQRRFSQYFHKPPTQIRNVPHTATSNDEIEREFLRSSRNTSENNFEKYPGLLSFQDLKQGTVPSRRVQNSNLVQRKSFEEQMNEENNLRSQNIFDVPVSNRDDVIQAANNSVHNFTENYVNRKNLVPHSRHFDMNTNFNPSFCYGNNIDQNRPHFENDNLIRSLNRSLSFEEKPNFENLNQSQNIRLPPRDVYSSQRNDMNRSFHARNSSFPQEWNMSDQNFGYQNNFSRCSNANRNFITPARTPYPGQNYGFSSLNDEIEMFPPNNDKEYVMNKFLYSINPQ